MRVYRFWSRAPVRAETPDEGIVHRSVWGHSDESVEAAEVAAADAAARFAERLRVEGSRATAPSAASYYPLSPTPEPILHEVMDEHGERVAAITLNRYGAEVLNTARLGFVDVDLATQQPGWIESILLLLGGTRTKDPATRAAEALDGWLREDGARGVRVYRTAAGLRYLIVNPPMDPSSDETGAMLARLHADPLFARLCRHQRSFRARLTPKPWRIGLGTPALSYERYLAPSQRLVDWMEAYAHASERYAACELVGELGTTTPPDGVAAELIGLHDDHAGVGTGRPLA